MIFTAIIYKTDAGRQKTAVTCIAENFDIAKKKLFSMYGARLVSIIYEAEKNLDLPVAKDKTSTVQSN